MSRERVVKALSNLGLTVKDIDVYFFLAREGLARRIPWQKS
jgi:hypothetical protein